MYMPSLIGSLHIVTNSGTINNGDSLITAPSQSSSKTINGAGTGLTGDFATSLSFFSATITYDPKRMDSSSKKVAKTSMKRG
jgi:spore germination protein PF